MAEKHYAEFDCDYCKSYPCKRFYDSKLGKIIRHNCDDLIEDDKKIKKEEENE